MKHFVFLPLILTVGCAQMIPARVFEVTPGVYKLESSGNAFASDESLSKKIESRAVKTCPNGFEYMDNSHPKWHKQTTYQNGIAVSAGYKVLTKTVRCK